MGKRDHGPLKIDNEGPKYPYLLVNMKGGISFLRVNGSNDF